MKEAHADVDRRAQAMARLGDRLGPLSGRCSPREPRIGGFRADTICSLGTLATYALVSPLMAWLHGVDLRFPLLAERPTEPSWSDTRSATLACLRLACANPMIVSPLNGRRGSTPLGLAQHFLTSCQNPLDRNRLFLNIRLVMGDGCGLLVA